MVPKNLRYASTHEWVKVEGSVCTIGITQFAVEQLTDVTYVELPDVGDPIFADNDFGEIESVKSVNDLYSPVSGEVIAINEPLVNDPSPITADPYGKGWLIKVQMDPGTKLDKLLTPEQYEKQIASQGH